ncbi:MAG: hypothetical protein AAB654_24990 [Acidobacteriota bacterium]
MKNPLSLPAALGLILASLAGTCSAGDWPQYKRDAARTGDAAAGANRDVLGK